MNDLLKAVKKSLPGYVRTVEVRDDANVVLCTHQHCFIIDGEVSYIVFDIRATQEEREKLSKESFAALVKERSHIGLKLSLKVLADCLVKYELTYCSPYVYEE